MGKHTFIYYAKAFIVRFIVVVTTCPMSIEPRDKVLGDIHLLELIFSFLDCSSVKTARLVCRFWYSTIEKPKFWRWAVVKVTDSNYRELMSSHRLNVVQMMMVGTSG